MLICFAGRRQIVVEIFGSPENMDGAQMGRVLMI